MKFFFNNYTAQLRCSESLHIGEEIKFQESYSNELFRTKDTHISIHIQKYEYKESKRNNLELIIPL